MRTTDPPLSHGRLPTLNSHDSVCMAANMKRCKLGTCYLEKMLIIYLKVILMLNLHTVPLGFVPGNSRDGISREISSISRPGFPVFKREFPGNHFIEVKYTVLT